MEPVLTFNKQSGVHCAHCTPHSSTNRWNFSRWICWIEDNDETFRILFVNIVRYVAHLVSRICLFALRTMHTSHTQCLRVCARCWLRKQQTGCIHVNQNQHASTTANTTFLFCFHYSLFFSSFLGVFFSFFLISTIIMLDYSLPALRLTIAKLLIKFSNINPIVVSVSHRYSLLFLKKIKWETNRNIKRAI